MINLVKKYFFVVGIIFLLSLNAWAAPDCSATFDSSNNRISIVAGGNTYQKTFSGSYRNWGLTYNGVYVATSSSLYHFNCSSSRRSWDTWGSQDFTNIGTYQDSISSENSEFVLIKSSSNNIKSYFVNVPGSALVSLNTSGTIQENGLIVGQYGAAVVTSLNHYHIRRTVPDSWNTQSLSSLGTVRTVSSGSVSVAVVGSQKLGSAEIGDPLTFTTYSGTVYDTVVGDFGISVITKVGSSYYHYYARNNISVFSNQNLGSSLTDPEVAHSNSGIVIVMKTFQGKIYAGNIGEVLTSTTYSGEIEKVIIGYNGVSVITKSSGYQHYFSSNFTSFSSQTLNGSTSGGLTTSNSSDRVVIITKGFATYAYAGQIGRSLTEETFSGTFLGAVAGDFGVSVFMRSSGVKHHYNRFSSWSEQELNGSGTFSILSQSATQVLVRSGNSFYAGDIGSLLNEKTFVGSILGSASSDQVTIVVTGNVSTSTPSRVYFLPYNSLSWAEHLVSGSGTFENVFACRDVGFLVGSSRHFAAEGTDIYSKDFSNPIYSFICSNTLSSIRSSQQLTYNPTNNWPVSSISEPSNISFLCATGCDSCSEPVPPATISSPTSLNVNVGATVSFVGSGGSSQRWVLEDFSVLSTQPSFNYIFTEPGSFTVTFITSNNCGASNSSNVTINVTDSVTPTFVCTGTTPNHSTICLGDDAGLTSDLAKLLVGSCTSSRKCEYTCNSGYTLSGGQCVAITPTASCTGIITSNASRCFSSAIPDVDRSFTLVSSCGSNIPQNACQVTCNSGYQMNGAVCEPIPVPVYSCTGSVPSSATICLGDDSGLTADTSNLLVSACTSRKCEYTCNSGTVFDSASNSCILIPTSSSCVVQTTPIQVNQSATVSVQYYELSTLTSSSVNATVSCGGGAVVNSSVSCVSDSVNPQNGTCTFNCGTYNSVGSFPVNVTLVRNFLPFVDTTVNCLGNQTVSAVPIPPQCTGSTPSNSQLCSGDDVGLTVDTIKSLVQTCTPSTKCEYSCSSGYHYELVSGTPTCVIDVVAPGPNCLGSVVLNATRCYPGAVPSVNQDYSLEDICPSPVTGNECKTICETGFVRSGDSCVVAGTPTAVGSKPDVIISDVSWKRGVIESGKNNIKLEVTLQNISAVNLTNAVGEVVIYNDETGLLISSPSLTFSKTDWATGNRLRLETSNIDWTDFLDQEVKLRVELVFSETNPVGELFNGNVHYSLVNIPNQDAINAPDVPSYAFLFIGLFVVALMVFRRTNKD